MKTPHDTPGGITLGLLLLGGLLAPGAAASDVDLGPSRTLASATDLREAASGDVDGDGRDDLLLWGVDGLRWLGQPEVDAGIWVEAPIDVAVNPTDAHLVDMDGDEDLDVVYSWQAGFVWWENAAGDGSSWTEHNVPLFVLWPLHISVVDMDGDGDRDIGYVNQNQNPPPQGFGWAENLNGAATAWSLHHFDLDFPDLGIFADMDGDGDPDLVRDEISGLYWQANEDGLGLTWSEARTIVSSGFFNRVQIHDLDGDGDRDVLAVRADVLAWFENRDGVGQTWAEHAIDEFPSIVSIDPATAVDLDGDGDLDVHQVRDASNAAYWYENLDGTARLWERRFISQNSPHFDVPVALVEVDAGHDGDQDFVLIAETAVIAYDNLTWNDHFQGLPGATTPRLRGQGPLSPDSLTHLRLSRMPEDGTAFLVIGLSTANAPFKGGVLVPSPDVVLALPTGDGSLVLSFPWPDNAPSNLSVHLQAWFPDASGPFGFTATNGLFGVTP